MGNLPCTKNQMANVAQPAVGTGEGARSHAELASFWEHFPHRTYKTKGMLIMIIGMVQSLIELFPLFTSI